MYSSEFDSDFDYLNSATPQQFEQPNQPAKPEVTNIERFWNLTGNWGEFGSYFGAGLSASLIVRAIPGADTCCCNSYPRRWFGFGSVHTLTADGSAKLRSQLILIAVATALLSANWDAWLAWVIANSQLLIFGFAVTVITLGFVGVQDLEQTQC
jgi:hypothetical protein